MGLFIDKEKCVLCGSCVSSCPNNALKVGSGIELITEDCILCGACVDSCPVEAISLTKESEQVRENKGGVWVAVQQSEGSALPVAFELLGKGRELANELNCSLTAVCISQSNTFAKELIEAGADEVLCCIADWLLDTDDYAYAMTLAPLIRERQPEIVLFGATILGRSAAPRVAAMLQTGLTADCTALTIEPDTHLLAQTRPALGGNLMATIVCPSSRPQMATVRPGVFSRPVPDASRTGKTEVLHPDPIHDPAFEVLKEAVKAHDSGVADARILLVAGRGIGSRKNLKKVFELASLMDASVGVSRPLIDMGWAKYPHQVGQTGASVAPDLLISLGVSGAIQHLAGIGGAKKVIAVNTDPSAPIMQRADYTVCRDCVEFIEEMINTFK